MSQNPMTRPVPDQEIWWQMSSSTRHFRAIADFFGVNRPIDPTNVYLTCHNKQMVPIINTWGGSRAPYEPTWDTGYWPGHKLSVKRCGNEHQISCVATITNSKLPLLLRFHYGSYVFPITLFSNGFYEKFSCFSSLSLYIDSFHLPVLVFCLPTFQTGP